MNDLKNTTLLKQRYMQLCERNKAICIYLEKELDISILEYKAEPLRKLINQGKQVAEQILER